MTRATAFFINNVRSESQAGLFISITFDTTNELWNAVVGVPSNDGFVNTATQKAMLI